MDKYIVPISNSDSDSYIWERALRSDLELRLPRDFDGSRLPENTKAGIYSETDSFVAWHLKSAAYLFLPNATAIRVARDFKADEPGKNFMPKDKKAPAWELRGSVERNQVGNPALTLVRPVVLRVT